MRSKIIKHQPKSLLGFLLLTNGLLMFGGCSRSPEHFKRESVVTNAPIREPSLPIKEVPSADDEERARSLRANLAYANKVAEQRARKQATIQVALPNFEPRPGRPKPIGLNFYEMSDDYPNYLLCTYDVSENHYDPTNEPVWFEEALLQIRAYGQQGFPPIRWVCVVISNRTEHKGASTFEQSRKVRAIFNAADVFDFQRDLTKSVAQAEKDRHPFKYDPRSEPDQRWLIVERHMAANKTSN